MIVPGEETPTTHAQPGSTTGQLSQWLVPLAAVCAIVLLLTGQWLIGRRDEPTLGALAIGLATVLFLAFPLAAGRVSLGPAPEKEESRHPLVRPAGWRWVLAVLSGLMALWAFRSFAGNRLLPGLWPWAGAIFYYLAATARRPTQSWREMLVRWWRKVDWRVVALLLLITLVGIFFRSYRLASVPAEMTSDHAEKLLDVYDVLNGRRPIFFPRNTGREAFQFYLTAALIRFTPLPLGHLALKVGTALFGIVTVPFTFLLGRELYGRDAGLLAAFFIAISHWHVAITRVGLRFPFTAAFATPALYFLFRSLRRNRRNDWLAAGLVLGFGLHTYTAMRIVPLLFALLVLMKAGSDAWRRWRANSAPMDTEGVSGWSRSFWLNAFLGAAAAFLVFLPLLRFMVDRPDLFWYRAASRALDGLPLLQQWRTFWQNTADALLMFNYIGDVVPANTIPESPALGLVAGGLFPLGLAYVLWRLVRYRERRAAYVLLSFFVLLLPSILSLAYPAENPSVVRTGGAVPFVMLIVSLPLVAGGRRLWRSLGRTIVVPLTVVLAVLLSLATVDNLRWYFIDYDASVRVSLWNATEMGGVVRDFVEEAGSFEDVYHVAYPHWVDTRNIAITAGNIRWRNAILDLGQIKTHAKQPGRKLYLVHPAHQSAIKVLKSTYPQGSMQRFDSPRPGKDFLMFTVPPHQE